MNREIKFEVLVIGNNKELISRSYEWLEPDGWKHDYYEPIVANGVFHYQDLGDGWNGEIIRRQFTGLLDKNGIEIYEGDIVEAWSEGYSHTGEIRWRFEGQPAIIIYPAFANQGFWKLHGQHGVDDGVKVIGNIYQNPELLIKK